MPNSPLKNLTRNLIIACSLLPFAACGAGEKQAPPNSAASASDTDGAGACAGPGPCELPAICQRYVSTACIAVGDHSAACKSLQAAAPLLPPEACEAALHNVEYTRKSATSEGALCMVLADKLCNELGEESESCQVVREQTPGFPPDRCELMLKRFPEVLEDLQAREQANQPLDDTKWASITAADAPSFGPLDAKIVLVEFSDFQCPYCARAADVARQVKERFGEKVRFVFRQFPLPMHPNASLAAQAALAAHAQGKFWEYHDALFANQTDLEKANLVAIAEKVGLDVEAFTSALDAETYKTAVDGDFALGESLPVRGTPTIYLNRSPLSNATSFEDVARAIEATLETEQP